jgi:hypothetical protein
MIRIEIDAGLMMMVEQSLWYPAPNLDRASAPSWVGPAFCLTQELVNRLNFGSASTQAAPQWWK